MNVTESEFDRELASLLDHANANGDVAAFRNAADIIAKLRAQVAEAACQLEACKTTMLESQRALKLAQAAQEILERRAADAERRLAEAEARTQIMREALEAVHHERVHRVPPDKMWCEECQLMNGHADDCTMARVEAALSSGANEDGAMPGAAACRVCGCTDDEACEGGCCWVEDPEGLGDLCSRCLAELHEKFGAALRALEEGEVVDAAESPRSTVHAFARAMERELKANDHKGGWRDCDPAWLLSRLREEADELAEAVSANTHVLAEAADVANYAMMIADRMGALERGGPV